MESYLCDLKKVSTTRYPLCNNVHTIFQPKPTLEGPLYLDSGLISSITGSHEIKDIDVLERTCSSHRMDITGYVRMFPSFHIESDVDSNIVMDSVLGVFQHSHFTTKDGMGNIWNPYVVMVQCFRNSLMTYIDLSQPSVVSAILKALTLNGIIPAEAADIIVGAYKDTFDDKLSFLAINCTSKVEAKVANQRSVTEAEIMTDDEDVYNTKVVEDRVPAALTVPPLDPKLRPSHPDLCNSLHSHSLLKFFCSTGLNLFYNDMDAIDFLKCITWKLFVVDDFVGPLYDTWNERAKLVSNYIELMKHQPLSKGSDCFLPTTIHPDWRTIQKNSDYSSFTRILRKSREDPKKTVKALEKFGGTPPFDAITTTTNLPDYILYSTSTTGAPCKMKGTAEIRIITVSGGFSTRIKMNGIIFSPTANQTQAKEEWDTCKPESFEGSGTN